MRLTDTSTVGRAAFTGIKAGIADKALSEKIDTVQASLGDDIASVEQSLTAEVDAVEGTVSSLYTLRTDVNGRVAGFGLSNDGATSAFGIVADQFYIADPDNSTNEAIPFIHDNGTLYLREALIGSLTFNKLQDDTGTFIVQNGRIQAEYIEADQLQVEWANIQNVDIVTADIQDAAITRAKIGNAQVDTLQLAGQAVTIPESNSRYGVNIRINSSSTDYDDLAVIVRVTPTLTGNPVLINLSFNTQMRVGTSASNTSVRVYSGGSLIHSTPFFVCTDSIYSFSVQRNLGSGSQVIEFKIRTSGDFDVMSPVISAIEVKR
jgi:hypothetical protein